MLRATCWILILQPIQLSVIALIAGALVSRSMSVVEILCVLIADCVIRIIQYTVILLLRNSPSSDHGRSLGSRVKMVWEFWFFQAARHVSVPARSPPITDPPTSGTDSISGATPSPGSQEKTGSKSKTILETSFSSEDSNQSFQPEKSSEEVEESVSHSPMSLRKRNAERFSMLATL